MTKGVRIKTEAPAHVVIRDVAGTKLFDMSVPGVSIVVAVPSDAKICVDPQPRRDL
jgi:hypothetical protein